MSEYRCPQCDVPLAMGATSCWSCKWELPKLTPEKAEKTQLRAPLRSSMTHEQLRDHEHAQHANLERRQEILVQHQHDIDAVAPSRRWAKRILVLHEAGYPVEIAALEMARGVNITDGP